MILKMCTLYVKVSDQGRYMYVEAFILRFWVEGRGVVAYLRLGGNGTHLYCWKFVEECCHRVISVCSAFVIVGVGVSVTIMHSVTISTCTYNIINPRRKA
jgi:hypothetical protein